MIPDIDVLHESFTTGALDDLTGAEGAPRIFLTTDDLAKARTFLEAQEASGIEATFNCFEDGYLMANLWVNNVSFTFVEKSIIEPHLNDRATMYFFGQSPIQLQATGVLINPYDNSHKAALHLAYKNILRLYQAARIGIMPALSFVGYTIPGAMLTLQMGENATQDGQVQVSLTWLVSSVIVQSMDNESPMAVTNTEISFTGNSS
jgi:hypothetical protein